MRRISRQPVKMVDFICDKRKTTLYVDESESIALKHKTKRLNIAIYAKGPEREREYKYCRSKHVFYYVSLVVLLVLVAFLSFSFSLCTSSLLFRSSFLSLLALSCWVSYMRIAFHCRFCFSRSPAITLHVAMTFYLMFMHCITIRTTVVQTK